MGNNSGGNIVNIYLLEHDSKNNVGTYSSGGWDAKTWAKSPDQVDIRSLGRAMTDAREEVVCASFEAGEE